MTKRTLTFLLCTLLVASVLILPAVANTILPGDLNGDEQRTAIDYFALKRYILGTHSLSESALVAADLNSDGEADAQDYMILKRVILGTYVLSKPEEEFPEDTLSAIVKLSVILQNDAGKEVAVLENTLPLDTDIFGKLLEDYFASDPVISEEDIASLIGDEAALQAFAKFVAQAILDGFATEQQ